MRSIVAELRFRHCGRSVIVPTRNTIHPKSVSKRVRTVVVCHGFPELWSRGGTDQLVSLSLANFGLGLPNGINHDLVVLSSAVNSVRPHPPQSTRIPFRDLHRRLSCRPLHVVQLCSRYHHSLTSPSTCYSSPLRAASHCRSHQQSKCLLHPLAPHAYHLATTHPAPPAPMRRLVQSRYRSLGYARRHSQTETPTSTQIAHAHQSP